MLYRTAHALLESMTAAQRISSEAATAALGMFEAYPALWEDFDLAVETDDEYVCCLSCGWSGEYDDLTITTTAVGIECPACQRGEDIHNLLTTYNPLTEPGEYSVADLYELVRFMEGETCAIWKRDRRSDIDVEG